MLFSHTIGKEIENDNIVEKAFFVLLVEWLKDSRNLIFLSNNFANFTSDGLRAFIFGRGPALGAAHVNRELALNLLSFWLLQLIDYLLLWGFSVINWSNLGLFDSVCLNLA